MCLLSIKVPKRKKSGNLFNDLCTVSLRHLWAVRPYASWCVFLFSGSFIEVLSSSLRMVYLSYVPPTHEYGTRPFLRWVRSQGRSPHASGKVKNSFDPVGILLFGAPQAPGNKPNPLKGVKDWGDGPLRPEELSSADHPRQNRTEN